MEWNGWDWGLLGWLLLDITSDDWDHSQKFPAFSTSKYLDQQNSTIDKWSIGQQVKLNLNINQ